MGFLDSVKNVLKGAVAAPPPRPVTEPAAPEPAAPTATTEQAPEPTPERTPEPTFETYTIRTGDTLRDIGARHGVARDELARLNGIDEPDLIFPGQEIRVPTR